MAQAEPLPHQRQTMGPVGLVGAHLARARKAVVTALGMAVALVLLIPHDSIPETWRPWVGVLLAAGTVAGVYRVRNDLPPTPAASSIVTPAPRQRGPRE